MFERFTDKSRRAVVLAQEEARLLDHGYIGTEHLLAGLCRVGGGAAAKALESAGVTTDAVRAEIERTAGRGQKAPSGHIPFTPGAKRALERSLREALQLSHNYIGTGHLLLGLISLDDDTAVQVLGQLGADLDQLRERAIQETGADPEEQDGPRIQVRPGDTIQGLLDTVDRRLGAIERHLEIFRPGNVELRRYDQQIAMVRHEKEAAIERQDFEAAAALRDSEKQLMARRAQAVEELAASGEGTETGPETGPGESSAGTGPGASSEQVELARLRAEVARLRALLREHDIDPGDPPAVAG